MRILHQKRSKNSVPQILTLTCAFSVKKNGHPRRSFYRPMFWIWQHLYKLHRIVANHNRSQKKPHQQEFLNILMGHPNLPKIEQRVMSFFWIEYYISSLTRQESWPPFMTPAQISDSSKVSPNSGVSQTEKDSISISTSRRNLLASVPVLKW